MSAVHSHFLMTRDSWRLTPLPHPLIALLVSTIPTLALTSTTPATYFSMSKASDSNDIDIHVAEKGAATSLYLPFSPTVLRA